MNTWLHQHTFLGEQPSSSSAEKDRDGNDEAEDDDNGDDGDWEFHRLLYIEKQGIIVLFAFSTLFLWFFIEDNMEFKCRRGVFDFFLF